MIKRFYTSTYKWHDIDNKIFDETTLLEIRFLGILLRKREVTVSHEVPEDSKKSDIGFGQ